MSATTVVEAPIQTAPARPAQPAMTPDRAVELFVRLRDKKAELKRQFDEQIKPYNEALAKLDALLLDTLNQLKAQTINTEHGTFYRTTDTSVTVNRWSETLAYVQENDAWELLEARVNKTAALAITEEKGAPPPGVAITQIDKVGVRRPSK